MRRLLVAPPGRCLRCGRGHCSRQHCNQGMEETAVNIVSAITGRAMSQVEIRSRAVDRRPTHEVYADQATSESVIIGRGIRTRDEMAAVMGRKDKPEYLVRTLISLVVTAWASWPNVTAGLDDDEATDVLVALTREPALTSEHLATMVAWPTWQNENARQRLVMAVCTHQLAGTAVVMGALWDASTSCAQAVAPATGSLVAAATVWMRAKVGLKQFPVGVVTQAQRENIAVLADRWQARAAGDKALESFLVASSHRFTDEDEMFAAGAAVVAQPVRR